MKFPEISPIQTNSAKFTQYINYQLNEIFLSINTSISNQCDCHDSEERPFKANRVKLYHYHVIYDVIEVGDNFIQVTANGGYDTTLFTYV